MAGNTCLVVCIASMLMMVNAFSVTKSNRVVGYSTTPCSSLPSLSFVPASTSSSSSALWVSGSSNEESEEVDENETVSVSVNEKEEDDSEEEEDGEKDLAATEETPKEEESTETESSDNTDDDDTAEKETAEEEEVDVLALVNELLQIAAGTGRGEFATSQQKEDAANLVSLLEASSSKTKSDDDVTITGTWELVYSSTQLFRSSPFFMAGRATCKTPEEAKQYDWFCDMHRAALAISNIGSVRQIISETKLTSEFEVKVGSIPFVTPVIQYSGGWPLTIEGAIVSTADIVTKVGNDLELLMDTVEIKGSNIPGLRQLFDNGILNKLESRDLGSFLEENIDSYSNPTPYFQTTFLDKTTLNTTLRINRDQDGKIFVYRKVSDSTEVTNYDQVEADLGINKLVDGFSSTFFNS